MNWLNPLWEGLLQGVVINLLSFGPSFFTLIHTGIRDGKKHGLSVAFGIFMSEVVVASVLFFGLRSLFVNPYFQMCFTAFAAAGLIYMGVRAIRHRYVKFLRTMNIPVKTGTSMLRGFLLNLVNPFVILLWVSLISTVSLHYTADQPYHEAMIMINILCILLGYFGMDIMKVYLSDRIGRNLNHRVTFLINRYFGYILTVLGAYFVYHFLRLTGWI
jgi:threonine/homoserine/homoserine lactone efflux protein